MSKLQASAMMKIPQDKLEEFKKEAEEYIKQVKDKQTGTLQCDWFLSSDMTECEIRETYESSEAALTHQSNIQESIKKTFEKFGTPYSVTIYGNPSSEVLQNARVGGLDAKVFPFLVGI
jgi:quinol monooxygenase YgiN